MQSHVILPQQIPTDVVYPVFTIVPPGVAEITYVLDFVGTVQYWIFTPINISSGYTFDYWYIPPQGGNEAVGPVTSTQLTIYAKKVNWNNLDSISVEAHFKSPGFDISSIIPLIAMALVMAMVAMMVPMMKKGFS